MLNLNTLQVTNPSLYTTPGDLKHKTTLSNVDSTTFYVYWNLGYLKKIYFGQQEDASLANFKKGIASLFQYQLLDGKYVEEDTSGTCDVQYTSHSSTRYHKAKNNCKFVGDRFERTEYPLRSLTRTVRSADFTVSTEGTLEKIVAQDYVKYLVNAYDGLGAFLESTTKLELETGSKKVSTIEGKSVDEVVQSLGVHEHGLLSEDVDTKCVGDNCDNVSIQISCCFQTIT